MPLQARQTFWWGQRVVNQGDIVKNDDLVVKGREHLFIDADKAADPVSVDIYAPIEQATAAPGEKRRVPKGLESLRPQRQGRR